ncbi:hypothetical protein PV326_006388 [Microctonus aethiopoides]|nr:hypothetical protein PV326_006388 [Microctonus aethiopoides]
MAEDTEVPVENAPKTEIMPDQNIDIGEVDKQEVCVNEAESSLIEDQTMPSYLSITSNGSSLKPDNSKVEPDPHDEDIKPVYDVSSGDEDQENNRHYDDDDDDDEDDEDDDEYDDDDDEDEDEIDEDYEEYMNTDGVPHRNGIRREVRYDESEEDDCEEDEKDGETDGDVEPEQFERSSDDFTLRTSNSNLGRLHIERSRSLQELSSPKKSPRFNRKRQTLFNPYKFDVKYHIFEDNELKQRSSPMSRHNYGYSKVKYCIQERRELNRRLSPQKSDDKVNYDLYTVDADQSDIIQETDNLRPNPSNPQSRRLKSYAESAIKDILAKEDLSHQTINIANDLLPLVNGDEMISIDAIKQHHELTSDDQETMEIDENNTQYVNCNKQIIKPNGTIEYSTINTEVEVEQKENEVITQLEPLINGEITSGPIVDVQTLTYDSYMKGNADNNHKPDEIADDNIKKCINVNEVIINSVIPSPVQAESIMPDDELPLENEIILNNEPEIASVRQKSIEYNEENKDYQRMLNENLELKKQIEELKKVLVNQQNEIKRKEVKIAAVQTEDQPRLMKHTSTTTHLQLQEKLSASTIPDIGSTLSSIENWTDSEYSPAVSLKPPNVDHILNSDQSTNQTTPRNPSKTSSRALWTTNRILQTLANLTPSRAIPNLTEKKFDVPGQSKDPISPLISGGQNFRKRKASDNIGTSVFGPLPSKIPFTNKSDASKKFNSASDTDAAIKSTAAAAVAADQSEKIPDELQQNANDETEEDDIKCFVWHENDNTQERSCLIQAPIGLEGSTKNVGESKKVARECGPYLLGNLEVRITEANGTLNIWGKEVNQNSSLKESDAISEEQNESVDNSKNIWPKTPRTMTDNQFKCSTNKKIKTPSTVRANISRHLRGMLNRTPSPVNIPMENHSSDNHPNSCHRHNENCDSYHSHKRLMATVCHNHTNLQTKSSCCAYKPETNVRDCGCRRAHEQIIENNHCHCEMLHHCILPSSNFNRHCGNIRQNHFDFDHLTDEKDCKHPACHRLSDSEFDNCCKHVPKRRCHSAEINGCDHHHVEKICCQEMMNACSTHSSSEETDPIVNFEKSDEVPEKRHRLRGKRVRNLMGFLKGCSDCQNPETSSIDSCQIPETETTNTRSIPSIRVISDPSPTTSYRKSFNNSQNYNSCIKHAGRAAELEAELEIMRVEISKLHSRSNAMRDMLHRVLQTDSNTAP